MFDLQRRAVLAGRIVTPMDGQLLIRRLSSADDLEAFGGIVLASYLALWDMPPDSDYGAELVDVAGRVREGVVFGAFIGEVPTGCVTFVADGSSPHAEDLQPGESSFRMLAVDTSTQGRGIGEALVRRCLDEAMAIESPAVFIYSGSWMHAAHRLYGRMGFEFVPERDWIINPDVHLLGVHKSL